MFLQPAKVLHQITGNFCGMYNYTLEVFYFLSLLKSKYIGSVLHVRNHVITCPFMDNAMQLTLVPDRTPEENEFLFGTANLFLPSKRDS